MPVAVTNTAPAVRPLRTSDPRLPLVVGRAAIEFDMASKGEVVDFSHAKLLASFLRAAFEQSSVKASQARNLDVGTVGIVGRALVETKWQGRRIKTVLEVFESATQIAESIESIQSKASSHLYKDLRAFCVALGNRLLAYRESLLQHSRPPVPYRR